MSEIKTFTEKNDTHNLKVYEILNKEFPINILCRIYSFSV